MQEKNRDFDKENFVTDVRQKQQLVNLGISFLNSSLNNIKFLANDKKINKDGKGETRKWGKYSDVNLTSILRETMG